MEFETVIGLEVHAQLLTKSKMFCRCNADYSNAPPNTHVCPVCMALPGVLPVINRKAVEFTMMTALALHCPISEYTKFDRKNYPYPDLVKGYQISQFDAPIGLMGYLDVETDGQTRRIGITSEGGESYSLVDINRSGVPLMEVVGDPDLRSPEEARQYLMKLRSILQYLGVSNCNMDEGSFRCDANISIRPMGSTEYLGKVEVKNMNSFKAVYLALEYEAKRQRKAVSEGKRIHQETRGWVEEKGKTVSQRSKEFAHDYRYFPEPDLPPLSIGIEWVEEVRAKLTELPEARRDRLMQSYGLTEYDANLLTSSRAMADYYEDCLNCGGFKALPKDTAAKEVSNWLNGETSRILNVNGIEIDGFREKVTPERLCDLIAASHSTVNMATAKTVLEDMFSSGKSANDIIAEKGLAQISDSSALEATIAEVIQSNPQALADFKAGKEQAVKFLLGQVMKATKGRANPKLVGDLLQEKLASL